jgi:hypothetical protein
MAQSTDLLPKLESQELLGLSLIPSKLDTLLLSITGVPITDSLLNPQNKATEGTQLRGRQH